MVWCICTILKGSFLLLSFDLFMSSEAQMLDVAVHWPDGDDLAKVKLVIINLCNEYGCHSLIESGAIHVDGGTNGEHKADDAAVNVVVLQEALEGYRQCGRAGEDRIRRGPQNTQTAGGIDFWFVVVPEEQLSTICSHAAEDNENKTAPTRWT